jgi:hypothetical protein
MADELATCSICLRSGLGYGPYRLTRGHCVCVRCWQEIALTVLDWLDHTQFSSDATAKVMADLLKEVRRRSLG